MVPLDNVNEQAAYARTPCFSMIISSSPRMVSEAPKRAEVVYGVTSLSAGRPTPARLLALVRGHWHIGNKSHWVRDVTCDEDRPQVRCGQIPQVMAALRNTALGLLRWQGYTNIAACWGAACAAET